jgi:hypothetical protein
MTRLGSNINSELFLSTPINISSNSSEVSNTKSSTISNNLTNFTSETPTTSSVQDVPSVSSITSSEQVYIIKGSDTIDFTDGSKNFNVNLKQYQESLRDLHNNVHNTPIHSLIDPYKTIFSHVMTTLSLSKNSPPVQKLLLDLTEKTFSQDAVCDIGTVGSYFIKNSNKDFHPNNTTSVFNTFESPHRVLLYDSEKNELFSLTPNESNSPLAYIYIAKDPLKYLNKITNQLIYNGVSIVKLFSNYNMNTKNYGFISSDINLEDFNNSSLNKNTINKSIPTTEQINTNNTTTSQTTNNSGLVFFIILLIIIFLSLALIYRYNF